MNFKSIIFFTLIGLVWSETVEYEREGRFINYKKKGYGDVYKKMEKSEMEEMKRSEEHARAALNGVYTECLPQISFLCIQKKVLNFVNRMSRMEKFSLLGNYVSIVRTGNELEKEEDFQARMNSAEQESQLDHVMDATIDRFFNTHIFRVHVPNSFSIVKPSESRSLQPSTYLDFRFPYSNEVEARKKGGGKMGKKMMMMMMMGLKAKLMMMVPLILGIAGIMAIKALVASAVSLTISKIMIIKKLMKNKGGGGGHGGGGWDSSGSGGGGSGWSSGGGGGGWDRRSFYDTTVDNSWDASDLAYRAYSTIESLF